MEMGNVSKRQQPDHRADNNRRPPMGLQCSEKRPHPEASFIGPLNKYAYYFGDNGSHTKLRIIHNKTKINYICIWVYLLNEKIIFWILCKNKIKLHVNDIKL